MTKKERDEKIVLLYRGGLPATVLCDIFGMTRVGIYKILKANGIKRRRYDKKNILFTAYQNAVKRLVKKIILEEIYGKKNDSGQSESKKTKTGRGKRTDAREDNRSIADILRAVEENRENARIDANDTSEHCDSEGGKTDSSEISE